MFNHSCKKHVSILILFDLPGRISIHYHHDYDGVLSRFSKGQGVDGLQVQVDANLRLFFAKRL